MADYYPLIARAVAGLEKSTGDARRALYERARAALLAQLRGVDPPIAESEVTRERLALEEAIRKVEAEAARRQRMEPQSPPAGGATPAPSLPLRPPPPGATSRPPMPPPSRAGMPASPNLQQPPAAPPRFEPRRAAPPLPAAGPAPQPPPAPPRAPSPPLQPPVMPSPLRPRGGEGFDDLRAELGVTPPPRPAAPPPVVRDPFADIPAAHDFDRLDNGGPRHDARMDLDALRPPAQELPPYELPPPEPAAPAPSRRRDRGAQEQILRPRRNWFGLVKLVIGIVLFAGLVAFGYWQRNTITGLYQVLRGQPSAPVARQAPAPTSASQGKIADRIGPGQQAGPAVAQRVVLYEEEPSDPQGKRYVGSAIWRTETVSPGPGLPPELAVRADVEIPERRITMKFSIRRNTDQTLPASHTIEIVFNLPADFSGGGISNVPGILMKQSEQTRGVPLSGLAVKVMTGFFLVGLSAVDADVQRNIQLLKERAWFDIPVVYNNNRRAILALEKGTPGERAFAEAFATWKQ
jgi:hypothetical protein